MTNHNNTRRSIALVCLAIFGLSLISVLPALAAEGAVNVNKADAETLALLPRVGPAVAARIIEYREQNGGFQKKEELLLVRGIGDRTFELLEPYVVLEGDSTLTEKVRVPRAATQEAGR